MARTRTSSTTSTVKPNRREATPRADGRTKAEATRTARAQERVAPARCPLPEKPPREREESTLEIEFVKAMQEYKQSSGRMFPTWSEVLEVLQNLGYRKPGQEPQAISLGAESS